MIDELVGLAKRIHAERYAAAEVTFLAGSIVRGEGTRTSDLDLVVVFERLPNAYRESFICGGWPVEAFVHDPETLDYFFWEVDRPSGVPSLPTMVREGIEVPRASGLSRSLKELADRLIAEGPPLWSDADVDGSRYAVTGLIDDLRAPRSRFEQAATATALYGALANHYLRSRGLWSGKDKWIPRRLRAVDPVFARKFEEAFEELFRDGDSSRVIRLAAEILAGNGGWLFENYQVQAPQDWKRVREERFASRGIEDAL
jgi:hypothetical protein